jgi:hypothetical protein
LFPLRGRIAEWAGVDADAFAIRGVEPVRA